MFLLDNYSQPNVARKWQLEYTNAKLLRLELIFFLWQDDIIPSANKHDHLLYDVK